MSASLTLQSSQVSRGSSLPSTAAAAAVARTSGQRALTSLASTASTTRRPVATPCCSAGPPVVACSRAATRQGRCCRRAFRAAPCCRASPEAADRAAGVRPLHEGKLKSPVRWRVVILGVKYVNQTIDERAAGYRSPRGSHAAHAGRRSRHEEHAQDHCSQWVLLVALTPYNWLIGSHTVMKAGSGASNPSTFGSNVHCCP